jgi:hypothetical protein
LSQLYIELYWFIPKYFVLKNLPAVGVSKGNAALLSESFTGLYVCLAMLIANVL